jgi:hypothetical protein
MARHLESERNRLRGALSDILKWVDENVQPANSLMGVRPKTAASTQPALAGTDEDATTGVDDDGAPTLDLHSASNSAAGGSHHAG